jgi:hypothetical protein
MEQPEFLDSPVQLWNQNLRNGPDQQVRILSDAIRCTGEANGSILNIFFFVNSCKNSTINSIRY